MIQQILFEELFKDAFDTYKAFDGLIAVESGRELHKAKMPATIWQIINHLIAWHTHQIKVLKDPTHTVEADELETWIDEEQANSQKELDKTVVLLYDLLDQVKKQAKKLNPGEEQFTSKVKLLQEISTHLAYHVGEVVLIRRMTGNYPLPHQMKEFLNGHHYVNA
ncbi:hypothetical protein DYU05_15420 [Mucilaginibacter terrenus]|uniref:DinB family protein n=1 Tax=Mucilaginibacter terrenus TaxID=2482727 RepID=A0A3E2NM18_9SPHI|nr:hypothetical protein [Mucilaginibacter terrenus]RFZ82018.1 hypothetical protein DYU05_15420 [Mucilaginibacter terrenus]